MQLILSAFVKVCHFVKNDILTICSDIRSYNEMKKRGKL